MYILVSARQAALNALVEYQQMKNNPTEENRKALQDAEPAVEYLKKLYNINNVNEAASALRYSEYIIAYYPYFIMMMPVLSYLAYRANTFFNSPKEAKSIPLPSWVNELMQTQETQTIANRN